MLVRGVSPLTPAETSADLSVTAAWWSRLMRARAWLCIIVSPAPGLAALGVGGGFLLVMLGAQRLHVGEVESGAALGEADSMVDFGGDQAAAGVLADRVRFELRQPIAGPFAAVAALLRAFEGWSAVAALTGGDELATSGANAWCCVWHRSVPRPARHPGDESR